MLILSCLLTMMVLVWLAYTELGVHRKNLRPSTRLLTGTAGLTYTLVTFLTVASGNSPSDESLDAGLQWMFLSFLSILMLIGTTVLSFVSIGRAIDPDGV